MKSEHIQRKRVSPYVTQPKTLNMIMGHMAGVKVRHALCAGWVRAKELAYTALKLSPIAYALAPSPVTGALAVVNAVDTLIRVRNGDKVGLLEAGLVALSSIQGAAAQVTFTRIRNDTLLATPTDGTCTSGTEINCAGVFRSATRTNRTNEWHDLSGQDVPQGINWADQPVYGYCSPGIPQKWAAARVGNNEIVLPIAPDKAAMGIVCEAARDACSGSIAQRLTPTPSSTLTRSTVEPTSTAFGQTTTGAIMQSTPAVQVLTTPPNAPNNDALYASTVVAFGVGVGVGTMATCAAGILRSRKVEEQPDQPARMTSYVRPRLISESSNRSDASDLTLSPVYGESSLERHATHEVERRDEVEPVYATPDYYRMAPVAINLPEPVYAEPNYPPRAIESDYVDMGTVNPYANQTNL